MKAKAFRERGWGKKSAENSRVSRECSGPIVLLHCEGLFRRFLRPADKFSENEPTQEDSQRVDF